jgi:hypothetical protein
MAAPLFLAPLFRVEFGLRVVSKPPGDIDADKSVIRGPQFEHILAVN